MKHPFWGEMTFNVEVVIETNCAKCIHKDVCRYDMAKFCENYQFGTSEDVGCFSCVHRHSRWNPNYPVPCFKCKFYHE